MNFQIRPTFGVFCFFVIVALVCTFHEESQFLSVRSDDGDVLSAASSLNKSLAAVRSRIELASVCSKDRERVSIYSLYLVRAGPFTQVRSRNIAGKIFSEGKLL